MREKPIKCLAVKTQGGQLEDWEYTPEPLKPGDVGQSLFSATIFTTPMWFFLTYDLSDADVRVLYNGLCHTDLHVWREDWGPCPYPLVSIVTPSCNSHISASSGSQNLVVIGPRA